jgi:hypothetical protein
LTCVSRFISSLIGSTKFSFALLRLAVLLGAACGWTTVALALDLLPTPTPLESPPAISPTPPPLVEVNLTKATVTFSSGESAEVRSTSDVFPLVSADAGETVNIQFGFPLTAAGASLLAQPLDGGVVLADNLPIGLDGTVSMQFQLGALPGLYRVLLNVGGQIMTLQFSVPNPDESLPTPTPLSP